MADTKLIISSGDSSDADGFMTLPIYNATGADLLYFVNFSAIFDDDFGEISGVALKPSPAKLQPPVAPVAPTTPEPPKPPPPCPKQNDPKGDYNKILEQKKLYDDKLKVYKDSDEYKKYESDYKNYEIKLEQYKDACNMPIVEWRKTLPTYGEEYDVVSSGDSPGLLFQAFQNKKIHRGNWLQFYKDKEMTKYITFNSELECLCQPRLDEEGNILGQYLKLTENHYPIHKFVEVMGGQIPYTGRNSGIYTYIKIVHMLKCGRAFKKEKISSNPNGMERITEDVVMSSEEDAFLKPNPKVAKLYKDTRNAILDAIYNMTCAMVKAIWSDKGKVFIVGKNEKGDYNINRVNPFFIDFLSDDVETYANVIKPLTDDEKSKLLTTPPNIEPYRRIAIDFNGSFAFYSRFEDYMKSIIASEKLIGVYVMGGVESKESPKTLNMYNIVRLSSATMNQVYHPKNTFKFFQELKLQSSAIPTAENANSQPIKTQKASKTIHLELVTNNAINQPDSLFDVLGKDSEIESASIANLFKTSDGKSHSNWIAKNLTLLHIIFMYYAKEAKPIKLYDVPVAMKLAHDIGLDEKDLTARASATHTLYYDKKYSCNIVGDNKSSNHIEEYCSHLAEKYHPLFHEVIKFECETLLKPKPEIKLTNIQCTVTDLTSAPITKYLMPGVTNPMKGFEVVADEVNSMFSSQHTVLSTDDMVIPKKTTDGFYQFGSRATIIFSDEEGAAPFKQIHNGADIPKGLFNEEGYVNGTFNLQHHNLIFLGDVQDNARHNIRLMKAFWNLKTNNTHKVILIAGNRDVNKLRMADEYFLEVKIGKEYKPALLLKNEKTGKTHTTFNDLVIAVAKKMETTMDKHTKVAYAKRQESEIRFRFKPKELIANTMDVKAFTVKHHELLERDFEERVKRMYTDTFGAFRVENIVKPENGERIVKTHGKPGFIPETKLTQERIKMFNSTGTSTANLLFDELKLILGVEHDACKPSWYPLLVCALFNMLASWNWNNDDVPQDAQPYIGLYYKYLSVCDVCAVFERDVDSTKEYGFVSHAGMGSFESILSDELGYSYEVSELCKVLSIDLNQETQSGGKRKPRKQKGGATIDHNASLISISQQYKEKLINKIVPCFKTIISFNSYKSEEHKMARTEPLIRQLIHMSTYAKYLFENVGEQPSVYHHALSPIVGYRFPRGYPKNKSTFANDEPMPLGSKGGGKFDYMTAPTKFYNRKVAPGAVNVKWNIYGHQPRGVIPSVYESAGTYHICMDVSKIEDQTNDESYAILLLTQSEDKFIGRIEFKAVNVIHPTDKDIIKSSTVIYDKAVRDLCTEQKVPVQVTNTFTVNVLNNITIPNNSFVVNSYYSIKQIMIGEKTYDLVFYGDFLGAAPWPAITSNLYAFDSSTPASSTQQAKLDDVNLDKEYYGQLGGTRGGARKTRVKYSDMSQRSLLVLAKELKIKNRTTFSKGDLIQRIKATIRKQNRKIVKK